MQHFKHFTISSFGIKVSGTHIIKPFTLLVAHHLWSHKELPIIILFDFSSQVGGMLLDCTQERRSKIPNLGFHIWPYTGCKYFWTTQKSSHLNVMKWDPDVLGGVLRLLWKAQKPNNIISSHCKHITKEPRWETKTIMSRRTPIGVKRAIKKLHGKARGKWF